MHIHAEGHVRMLFQQAENTPNKVPYQLSNYPIQLQVRKQHAYTHTISLNVCNITFSVTLKMLHLCQITVILGLKQKKTRVGLQRVLKSLALAQLRFFLRFMSKMEMGQNSIPVITVNLNLWNGWCSWARTYKIRKRSEGATCSVISI